MAQLGYSYTVGIFSYGGKMLSKVSAECLKLIYLFLEGKITREDMVSRADTITNQQKSFPFQNRKEGRIKLFQFTSRTLIHARSEERQKIYLPTIVGILQQRQR